MPQRPSTPEELKIWSEVDRYYEDLLSPADPILEAALSVSRAAGLPDIQVSPLQGKFLHLLAKTFGARRILEIGTLGGYSTIWLARALPSEGRLLSLEMDPKHAEVARANVARAGLGQVVEIRLGNALETLPKLAEQKEGPFDLVFIDADKTSYPEYLEWARRLARKGSLLVADNVVRRGDVTIEGSSDPSVQGIRRMNEQLAQDPRLIATVIQTVGVKGHDGMTVILVAEDP
jgi:predicted O-methyltransferase YrrM